VSPMWFDRIKPRAFGRQLTNHYSQNKSSARRTDRFRNLKTNA
jgi:hypothetical protein